MRNMKTLAEIAKAVGGTVTGNGATRVTGIASASSASEGDLTFATDEKRLDAALQSRASAVIIGNFVDGSRQRSKPVIIAADPKLAFARAARLLGPVTVAGIHPTAVIDPSAILGENISVGALAVIEEGVSVGNDCRIGSRVVIHSGTTLGDRVEVQAGSVLGSTGFGYVRDPHSGGYERFPQVGRLKIGDDVEIGANCTIDRGALDATVLGNGVKLDNMVHIAHNVTIGENVIIAAQTGISGSVVIEKNVIIAGQVGIADHCRIEEGVVLGAQCGVPSNKVIRGPGVLFWGTPARPIKEYLRELATLARLAKKK